MAHFAQLNNNIVAQVIVVNNETLEHLPFPESESPGVDFCKSLFGADTEWKQTSYNASFRGNYAGVGFSYDETLDAFIPPQPFPSWTLNKSTYNWEPPVAYPDDGKLYIWDEETTSWVEPTPVVIEEPIIEEVSEEVSSEEITSEEPIPDVVVEPVVEETANTSSEGTV